MIDKVYSFITDRTFVIKISIIVLMTVLMSDIIHYYYYPFRICAMVLLGFLAIIEYKRNLLLFAIISGVFSVLFIPSPQMHLPKYQWQQIDLYVILFVSVSIAFDIFIAIKKKV